MSVIRIAVAFLLVETFANASARPNGGQIGDDSLSLAFRLGQSFGGKSEAIDAAPAVGGDCRRRVADELAGKLHAAGFFFERQFLCQLADNNLRDKVCRLYASESQSLVECLIAEDSLSAAGSGGNPPLLRILGATCDTYNNAIQRHAECITDIGCKMERECAVACRQHFGDSGDAADRRAEFLRAISLVLPNDVQVEGLCRVGLCAVRCVNAQLGECESDAKGDVAGVEQSALAAFYERASAFQMLAGLEAVRGADAATRIVKGGKLPRKCHAFVRKGTDEESASISAPAVIATPLDETFGAKSFKSI